MSKRQGYPWLYLVMGACAMLLGVLLYISGRGISSVVYQWIPGSYYIEKTMLVSGMGVLLQDNPMLTFSLPDGLWMFAVMCVQLWIWDRKFTNWTCAWMAIVYIVCMSNEVLQISGISPGTYDVNDVLFMSMGGTLPILIELTIQNTKKWKDTRIQY